MSQMWKRWAEAEMDAKSAGRIPDLGKWEEKNLRHPKTRKDHQLVESVVAAAVVEDAGVAAAAAAEQRMSLQMVVAVGEDEGK
jgi:hypothetical protein